MASAVIGDRRPDEAIVLAGGLGTRLRGVVDHVPKPMAPIAGRPFLAWLLDAVAAQGIRRAILSIGYHREAIQAYFGDCHGTLALHYAIEETPLGTGGALRRALGAVAGSHTYVLNGDTYQELDYDALAASLDRVSGAELAIALRSIPDASRYGRAVIEDGRIKAFESIGRPGPGLVNAGAYLLSTDLFKGRALPERFSFERDFLEPWVGRLLPAAYVAEGAFIDIGVPKSFHEAQNLIPRIAAAACHGSVKVVAG